MVLVYDGRLYIDVLLEQYISNITTNNRDIKLQVWNGQLVFFASLAANLLTENERTEGFMPSLGAWRW